MGDSRSILCKNGKAVSLSTDHKPSLEKEKARIENAGFVVQQDRIGKGLNLSRALGDYFYKNASKLGADKQAIICTPEIVEMKRSKEDEFIPVSYTHLTLPTICSV